MAKAKKKNQKTALWIFLGVLLFVTIAIVANRALVYDWWRGITYKPSEEMSQIRDDLELTSRGGFIFNAVQPVLSGETEFNANCRSDADSEIAVLGCFTGDSVFVYDVKSDELDGIKELTTAHELLHAVWARMSDGEKSKLNGSLKTVLEGNSSFLKEEMGNYSEDQRLEELYVRAGTEVKDLPSDLEEHYATIFTNQDAVVSFYDKYIRVFRELEAQRESVRAQLDELNGVIEQKNAEYSTGIQQLNGEISEFNECAETVGCFASQWAFNSKRAALVGEQRRLQVLYNEIDGLIQQYNQLVDQYNNNLTKIKKLNSQINSNSKVEGI